MARNHYEVVVGNIGTTYQGGNRRDAQRVFRQYVEQSQAGIGRAGDEPVTLFRNGEIEREYHLPEEEYLWIRHGDASDYNNLGDDLDAAVDSIKECNPGALLGVEGVPPRVVGIRTENCDWANYISLFWGDQDAEFTRSLSKQELAYIKRKLLL